MVFRSMDGFRKVIGDDKPISFTPSQGSSVGVELEFLLVDPETRNLVPRANDLINALGPEGAEWAKNELFQCIVEVISKKCDNIEEVRQDLSAKIQKLYTAADSIGVMIMASGTHPFARWREQSITDIDRYHSLVKRMGWPARRLMITGMHVHVGVDSGEKAVAILNSMCCYVPHLIALSASSPCWQGIDTQLASSRLKIFELLPTAGLPPRVTNWAEMVRLMRTLIAAGAITSIREIWWDVRPHPGFGTIEVRILDNPCSPTEMLALASLVQAIVAYLGNLYDEGVSLPMLSDWTIRENKWRAIRFAEKGDLIRNERGETSPLFDHIRSVIDDVLPVAEHLGSAPYFRVLYGMLEHGPGYRRQRAFSRIDGHGPELVDYLVHAYRNDEPFGHLARNVEPFFPENSSSTDIELEAEASNAAGEAD